MEKGDKMNEQDRFKEIAKIAADAAGRVAAITRKLADHDILMNDLSELVYQLGYIEGLSYVPEEEE